MRQDFRDGKILPRGTYADGCQDNDKQGTLYFHFVWDDYMRCSDFGGKYTDQYGCDYAEFENPERANHKVSCCACGGGCKPGEDCPDPEVEAKRLFDEAAAAKKANADEEDWKLADANGDGELNLNELSVAFERLCKELIEGATDD